MIMSQRERKEKRVKKILEDAAKALEAEGVKYFLGAVDRQPKETNGGNAYAHSDIAGEDMQVILGMALPTRQDLINLGIWVGQLINAKKQ